MFSTNVHNEDRLFLFVRLILFQTQKVKLWACLILDPWVFFFKATLTHSCSTAFGIKMSAVNISANHWMHSQLCVSEATPEVTDRRSRKSKKEISHMPCARKEKQRALKVKYQSWRGGEGTPFSHSTTESDVRVKERMTSCWDCLFQSLDYKDVNKVKKKMKKKWNSKSFFCFDRHFSKALLCVVFEKTALILLAVSKEQLFMNEVLISNPFSSMWTDINV